MSVRRLWPGPGRATETLDLAPAARDPKRIVADGYDRIAERLAERDMVFSCAVENEFSLAQEIDGG